MRVGAGNSLTGDVEVLRVDGNATVTEAGGRATVTLPAGDAVATVIPASPTAQQIATALIAAFPSLFTQAS